MGFVGNLAALVVLLTAITVFSKIKSALEYPKKPPLDDIWWGAGEPSKTDKGIRPFKINVQDEVSTKINLLKYL